SPPVNRVVALALGKYVNMKTRERTRGHYPAVIKAMEVVLRGAGELTVAGSLALEAEAVTELAKTEASHNLIRLFFLQEGARKLSYPTAQKLPPRKMAGAAVIGAGVMGASIAQWISAKGMRVVLKDVDASRVAAGMDRIMQLYANGYKRHTFTFVEARDGVDRISPSPGDFPMKGLDIIIEAAVEKMDLKKQIFAKLDEQAPPETILATNTSALSITEIASATKAPDRVVGIHFFNPVHKMQLVEVVVGKQTRPDVVQRALRFVQQIGKLPVVVQDSPGFLVNRILLPYLVEAACLFEEGATTEAVDEAMLEFGMPMGPLRLIDEVGVDISVDVAVTLAEKFSGRLRMPTALTKMLDEKLLGRKSGAGFYTYKGREQHVNSHVAKFRTGTAAAAYTEPELQRRMVLLMVNEAARCLEEKIVATPGDVDFGMVMGTGFAPFHGGPLAYADAVGIAKIVDDMKTLVQAAGPQYEPCALLAEMAAAGKTFCGGNEIGK
ncbi:MAG: 3-hydroxyacyl-CoA dehydrogenase NAD-binding domain-containing protein, partial [Chthoniobacteraceae bacterium]